VPANPFHGTDRVGERGDLRLLEYLVHGTQVKAESFVAKPEDEQLGGACA
jgi:hypothetical protein